MARLRVSRDKLLAEVDSLSAELERLGLENTALLQVISLLPHPLCLISCSIDAMPEATACRSQVTLGESYGSPVLF